MTRQLITAATLLLSTIATSATAGEIWTSANYGHGHSHGYGYEYGYGFRPYASTAAGSYLRGRAAVIDATGRYNLNTSRAAINAQQARRLAMENYEQSIDTYFQSRDKNRQYRIEERGGKVTAEDAARYSKASLPERATSHQVDPVFGTIAWPTVFEHPAFTPARQAVDQQFRSRGYTDGPMDMQKRQIVSEAIDAMEEQLKGFIGQMNSTEYLTAKNFLRTLDYEARFAPQMETVAQR